MTYYDSPHNRPNCEEILMKKDLWTLNKEKLEINDKLKNIIASKERENKLTIYSMLRSVINSIENSSSDLSSPEQRDEVSQKNKN